MGTDITVSMPEKNVDHFTDVFKIIRDVDKQLSTYKADSEVSQLNKFKKLQVSDMTYQAIALSLDMFAKTYGYFDPSLGQLTIDAYAFGLQGEKTPNENQIKMALLHTGGKNIQLIPPNTVVLKKNIKLDFGGIGKGIAVDLAIKKLKDHGVREGLVSASGDVHCLSICDMSVIDPFQPNRIFLVMKDLPKDSSISTSGTYERYIKHQKNHHLLNPLTGHPSQTFVSVTLVGSALNAELDAWATALSVMPIDQAIREAEKHTDFATLFILPDHKIILSKNFSKFVPYPDWKYNP
ncbi:MAG: FAD:protein FMN transferase [Bdellovibrionaceae bacterium]|nr:FAD:protein FMN transferase [Pseudobdellovibrionaceae bacterium]